MATVSTQYYTKQSITITLASLTDGSYRQSLAVDNSSDKYVDAVLGGSIRTGGTAPTAGGTIEVYAYGSWDGGTTYTAGCSGTDLAYTANGEEGLLRLVETIVVDTDINTDYVFGPVSMASVFGGILPVQWGLVIVNNCGTSASLNASGHLIEYQGVKYDSA